MHKVTHQSTRIFSKQLSDMDEHINVQCLSQKFRFKAGSRCVIKKTIVKERESKSLVVSLCLDIEFDEHTD